MLKDARLYGKKIEIDRELVKNFWNERAKNAQNLNAVLLGNQKNSEENELRNKKEFEIVENALGGLENLSVLDIGCGMGRWAGNLKNKNCQYTSIDFSSEFIKHDCKKYPDMQFFNMSAENMDFTKLNKHYDFVIVNGVLMYINDTSLNAVFQNIRTFEPKFIYVQESVSVMGERLTLNNFFSKELNKKYSSIYRIPEDYEEIISSILDTYKIVKNGMLLSDNSKTRQETNAKYWILERTKA